MEYRRFGTQVVLRLNPGEELCAAVLALAQRENIRLASVTAIGASDDVTLGVFDTRTKQYFKKCYNARNYELASVMGNLTRQDGRPYLHLHAVIGCPETEECHAGHLNAAVISAAGEIFLNVIDGEVSRRFDESVGLNVITF